MSMSKIYQNYLKTLKESQKTTEDYRKKNPLSQIIKNGKDAFKGGK